MTGPDFVIAGVARSGTSHLARFLDLQNEISIAKPLIPEPKFFSRDKNFNKGVQWYKKTFFSQVPGNKIKGEKSTEYFESEKFAERASKLFPDLKVIIILRNPTDRLVSNYKWSVKNGKEKRSLEKAVEDEISRGLEPNGSADTENTRVDAYVSRSLYFSGLKKIHSYFPSKNIFLINFHTYIEGSLELVNDLEEFLSVNFNIREIKRLDKNESKGTEFVPADILAKLKDLFREDIEKVNKKYKVNLSVE